MDVTNQADSNHSSCVFTKGMTLSDYMAGISFQDQEEEVEDFQEK
jgi:hypothetical protein